jgi:hypothetical protein
MITVCPNKVKTVPVSTTLSPVTLAAEVAVKRAFTKPMPSPVTDMGSMSRKAPTRINKAYPITDILAGLCKKRYFNFIIDCVRQIDSFFIRISFSSALC